MRSSPPRTRASASFPRVLILDVLAERQFTTKGSDTYAYYLITDDDFQELGPYIEELAIVGELADATTNFRFKVKGQKSYRGQSWTDFSGDVLTEQTTSSSPIVGTPYATRGDLNAPRIQLLVGVRNSTGSAYENGTISLKIVIKFWPS